MKYNYDQLAERLDKAALLKESVEQLSNYQTINIEEAYAIQSISIGRRLLREENFTGIKLGFTSKAKMEQMGVHDMIWGRLTDQMQISQGETIEMNQFIHPRAEPEIAFKISRVIDQELTMDNVKDYIYGVALAIEVIDSRYKDFKFSLEDVIADNCSSAGYCIGEWQDVNIEIGSIPISISVDGKPINEGNTSAILGDPWQSVLNASRLAIQYGIELQAGHIILAGAATAALYVEAGQEISVDAEGFDQVLFKLS